MELPSEPEWNDVLPRLRTLQLDDRDGDALQFAVSVPGGQIVGAFLTERLAREFVIWLGGQYVVRAGQTFQAMDEIARTSRPLREDPPIPVLAARG